MNDSHDDSDSSGGGQPPPGKRRRLSGAARKALEDLVLILVLFINESALEGDAKARGTARANLQAWARMYL